MTTYYITKCALTTGITKHDDLEIVLGSYVSSPKTSVHIFERLGQHAHETEAGAIAKAEAMRIAKIASLKKQIAKLEKLTFTADQIKAG